MYIDIFSLCIDECNLMNTYFDLIEREPISFNKSAQKVLNQDEDRIELDDSFDTDPPCIPAS